MKLTWFGGSTFRMHIGGHIIVTDAGAAQAPTDVAELLSAADLELKLRDGADDLPVIDAVTWRPPRAATVLEVEQSRGGVLVRRVDGQGLLLHAAGESPLLLIGGEIGGIGRWSREAVVVLHGEAVLAGAQALDLVERLAPRLLLLAASEQQVEVLMGMLREQLGETALVALEAGMALEA